LTLLEQRENIGLCPPCPKPQLLTEVSATLKEKDADKETPLRFEPAEVDIIIEGIGDESEQPENLVPEETSGPPVSRLGDVWMLGKHILVCGDSTDPAIYKLMMDDDKAEFVFTDPPYNVKIGGNVSGLGRVKHREFAMASGEMSESQFTTFLSNVYALLCKHSTDGSIHQICMDWRHMREMLAAGDANYFELKNVCIWNKTNAGMGSFCLMRGDRFLSVVRSWWTSPPP
jgi:hypothetical protein